MLKNSYVLVTHALTYFMIYIELWTQIIDIFEFSENDKTIFHT